MAKEKKKKKFTDDDRIIAERISKKNWFKEDTVWFKEQIEAKKSDINMELIKEIEEEARNRSKDTIFRLKDICRVLNWEFPRDGEVREKLAAFSNNLQIIHGADAPQMLWNGMVAVITRDKIDDPTDIFLSKKETQNGKKRKRIETAHGKKRIKTPKTEEEKDTARKERSRIRRKAKKLGVTPNEYKALEAEKHEE